MTVRLPWAAAMDTALYGPAGFYRRGGGAARHFRTSVTAGPRFAAALLRLLTEVDAALGEPDPLHVVDMGAGRGELVLGLRVAARSTGLGQRVRWHGVEIAERPASVPVDVAWSPDLPSAVTGLVVANEWLDNVPVDVVVQTRDGPRLVLVDPLTGREELGERPADADLAWLEQWWPLPAAGVGARAEVGRARDEAWAGVIRALERGVAVAVDYSTGPAERAAGGYAAGTLAGYRSGRAVAPVPDGSGDLTAHVALDACAAAGRRAGATATCLTTQREALRLLGVTGRRPAYGGDPRAYAATLQEAGAEAELIARGGLGDFGWLVQSVGIPLPPGLTPPTAAGGNDQVSMARTH